MKKDGFITVLCLLILWSSEANAQFSDDFSSSSLSTEWLGDRDHFVINDQSQLQLKAPAAGTSYLYRSAFYPDSFSLSFQLKMTFSPSNSNLCRIYFLYDEPDITQAKGYYLNFGENGNDDAIRVFRFSGDQSSLIASGSMGAIASEPVNVNFRLDYMDNGMCLIYTDYDGAEVLLADFEYFDDTYPSGKPYYFGIYLLYSTTRADKFFFDSFSLSAYSPDLDGPLLTDIATENRNTLKLVFNEVLDSQIALISDNYVVNRGVGIPAKVEQSRPNEIWLTFDQAFDARDFYEIKINNISDIVGNTSDITEKFLVPKLPEIGELLLSEILADPKPEGEDFIELYNNSDNYLQLSGLIVRNTARNEQKMINTSHIIAPGDYLAISENVQALQEIYKPPLFANFLENELPALNIASGNVSIYSSTNFTVALDSFNYNNDMHNRFINNTKGVSLERIDFRLPANSPNNWQSASSSINFGTPGYENSNSLRKIKQGTLFEIITKSFSPNSDPENFMIARYEMPKSGFVCNMSIYDSNGQMIRRLLRNELMGTQGIITWDGANDQGLSERMGIYVVSGDFFHADGDVIRVKDVCVIAENMD